MCKTLFGCLALMLPLTLASASEEATDANDYIRVEMQGQLKVFATAPGELGATMTVRWNADLTQSFTLILPDERELKELVRGLDGKTAVVTGTLRRVAVKETGKERAGQPLRTHTLDLVRVKTVKAIDQPK